MAAYADDLLFINDDSIVIDTGLSTREAAQAKLMQFLTEPGYIAAVTDHGAVSFKPYTFTESYEDIAKGRKNSSVFITGPAYDGIPLMELLSGNSAVSAASSAQARDGGTAADGDTAAGSGDSTTFDAARVEKARLTVEKICKIIEASFEQEIKLPNNGPLGTIVGADGSILFLPPSIFSRSLDSRGDSAYSLYEGCWKNTALTEKDCLRFTAAAYAYMVYSGKPPFTQKDSQLRAADFYDKNFAKLSWFCKVEASGNSGNGDTSSKHATDANNGAADERNEFASAGPASSKDFAKIFTDIEQNLSCSAPEMVKKRKHGKTAKKKATIPSVAITSLPAFDKRIISDVTEVPAYTAQQKTLKRVRFLRKNGTILNVCVVAFVVLCIIVAQRISEIRSRPTTVGKEPVEVVQMFYDGFDTLDTILFDATRTNGAGNEISNMIATVFVSAKMRESYEGKQTYTPSQWLNLKNPDKLDLYGLSRLEIEEEKEKAEDGVRYFLAHYYVLHTESNEMLVSEVNDELMLTYKKDRWLVSFFISEDHEIPVDPDAFFTDLRSVAPENMPYKAIDVIDTLSGKYKWLPTIDEVNKGYEQLFATTYLTAGN